MRLCFFSLCVVLASSAACGKPSTDASKTQAPVAAGQAAGGAEADAPRAEPTMPPTPPAPPTGITINSPGGEPLFSMGYGKLQPVAFELRFDTETSTKSGNLVSPTIVVTGKFTPSIEGDAGTLHFDIASFSAVDRERQFVDAAGINHYLKGYKPPSFLIDTTSAGELSPDTSVWKLPEMLFNQEQALHDIIAKWVVVFPDVAIGPGASWKHVKNDVVNGTALVRTSDVRLVKLDAPTASPRARRADIQFEESAGPQQAIIDGKPLQIIRYGATGSIQSTFGGLQSPWLAATTGMSTTTVVYDHRGAQQSIVRKTTWSIAPVSTSRKR